MKKRDLILGIMLVIFISGCINQSELPNANEIENISSSKFPSYGFQNDSFHPEIEENYSFSFKGINMTRVSLKEEAFKKIMKTAKRVSDDNQVLQNYILAPWYSGSFTVKNKQYLFNLYLAGLGKIVEVKQKKITLDLNLNYTYEEMYNIKGEDIFFFYSVDFNDTLQNNNENNVTIVLSGKRYIPKGMTTEQEILALLQNKNFAKENISLGLRFINKGKEIKILNVFKPIPVFFSLYIEREDGTPIMVPSGGKISFMKDSFDYITLISYGDQHYVTLNLGEVLPDGLEVGTYIVSAEYHNQYGDDCFKGSLKSDPITLEVVEKKPEEILLEKMYKKYFDNPKYCEKDTECICRIGSGSPFIGCSNFPYPSPGGSAQCTRCRCVDGTCQEVS